MAGGELYEGRVTPFVVITCLVAATGGLIFGYDIGVSGSSLHNYSHFPVSVIIYLVTLSCCTCSFPFRFYGNKSLWPSSMLFGGLIFLTGVILNGFATNIEMLIIGRLLLGVGVGFANQSVPVYLCEMAPSHLRGAFSIGFQMAITIGILAAGIINYGTAKIDGGNGWRISLGLAGVPAVIMTVGSLFLPDTPNSILERGYTQLVICIIIPFFQQLTGINVIMFYAPVLFKTLGFGDDASLMSAVITGGVNVLATFVSIYSADKFGRRSLFLEGGVQMVISQILVGIMIAIKFGVYGDGELSKLEANFILFLICIYVAAFAWSWGPLGWLVPSEICPLEIRSAGQAINVSVNMFFTFIIAQVFLAMLWALCHMKYGLFFFFAYFVIIMTIFVAFFIPETKNVPIEDMNEVWKAHWFWRKYIPDEALIGVKQTWNWKADA